MPSNKPELRILAIETSCDETAAAVIEVIRNPLSDIRLKNGQQTTENGQRITILSNIVSSQIDLHRQFGGVFPEMASRAHAEQIIPVIQAALETKYPLSDVSYPKKISDMEKRKTENGKLENIDLLAVTAGPGLIGSLLVGVNTAKTLAFVNKKPIIPINHWLGHIYSCFAESYQLSDVRYPKKQLSDNGKPTTENYLPQFPLLALIVSGGHTGLVYMESHTKYTQIGETLDDAVGEAFDKVAKLLQLPYPGGPAISAEAAKYKKVINGNSANTVINSDLPINNNKSRLANHTQSQPITFPRSMLDRADYNFSFSGLKTAVLNKVKELTDNGLETLDNIAPAIAYEFQQACIDILIGKTLKAAQEYKPKSIILCGGVSANKELRKQMAMAIDNYNESTSSTSVSFHVPPLDLTGDNAAMIGLAAAYQIANGVKPTDFSQICADSNLKLN